MCGYIHITLYNVWPFRNTSFKLSVVNASIKLQKGIRVNTFTGTEMHLKIIMFIEFKQTFQLIVKTKPVIGYLPYGSYVNAVFTHPNINVCLHSITVHFHYIDICYACYAQLNVDNICHLKKR